MKRLLAAATAILVLLVANLAQENTGSPPGLPKFTADQLRDDFRIARHALEEGHSGIYRYTSKARMDQVFDAAERSLDHPMDVLEFFRVLAPAVAAIKCGHTGVGLSEPVRSQINSSVLPLSVKVIHKRPYILRDLSSDAHRLAGSEIRSINNVPASTIISTLLAAASGDGDVETSRQDRISGPQFGVLLNSLAGLQSPYDLVLFSSNTRGLEKVHLEGVELTKLRQLIMKSYPQDEEPKTAAQLHYEDQGRIAVMKINGFGGTVEGETKRSLKEFYKDSFEEMQAKNTRALVLDLRNNGGGADELGKLLLSYLIDQPFKYYDDLVINSDHFDFMKYTSRPDFKITDKMAVKGDDGKYHATSHPNWGINQPSNPTFTGKVFILINGGSFSTTSEFLSQAHFHKRAVFIGEESGGGYYGNSSGAVPGVTLPNTRILVRVPLVTYYMAVSGYKAAAHGIIPDYPIDHPIGDLISGRDRDVEFALQLARK